MKSALTAFKFFASLGLAIFLLIALALVFAVGTFIESAYGTEAAKLLVYRSPWMSCLLILLALNVAAAALDRLPWKKKHVGFVITHAGILLILSGALITRAFGIEGQIAIQEEKTESRMILDQPLLQIFSARQGYLGEADLPLRAFAWTGANPIFSNPRIRLLRYLPKSSRQEKVEESSEGPAALEVALESSFMKVNHWLLIDDAERSQILLGPAELRFSREPVPLQPAAQKDEEGFLEFQSEDLSLRLPIHGNLGKRVPLRGTPYRVTVLRVLQDAIVDNNQLVDRSEDWKNPACELVLEGKDFKETHTVFANFPDFPTMHGLEPSQTGMRIYYRRAGGGEAGSKNELRFVWQENGLPLYQIKKGAQISQGTVQLSKDVETGWMDFKFRVERYYPHTVLQHTFVAELVSSQSEEHVSSIEVELERGEDRKSLWLGQGDFQEVVLGRESYQLVYGLRTLPVGFRLKLRDFRIEHYPGTGQPASFESDVTLKDDFSGTVRDATIRMNRPLKHRGFKIFQSGYQQREGEPEISVFTVAKDPGIGVKYSGALVLIGGILTMFYSRRFANRPQEKTAEVLVS